MAGLLTRSFHSVSGRKQRVAIDASVSSYKLVLHGSTQGSVLVPLLFIIYVNEVKISNHASFIIYAGYTSLYISCSNSEELLAKAQTEL